MSENQVPLVFDNNGIPVEPGRTKIVREITLDVTHCDVFSPCISWPQHKRDGRVDALFDLFKEKWNLPDTVKTRKWFNETANSSWNDFKTKKLKPVYNNSTDLETAKKNRPPGIISQAMWEELCDQFAANDIIGSDGKSKTEKCRDARRSITTEHHWGRTSISGWSYKYLKKFGKNPTIQDKFKKGYLHIDPLAQSSRSTNESCTNESHETPEGQNGEEQREEREGQQQEGGLKNPVLRQIADNLGRVYEECIRDGSDESTANATAYKEVLNKKKGLGIASSSQPKKVARSSMSKDRDARDEEMQILKDQVSSQQQQIALQQQQMALQRQQMEAMMEIFRSQGHMFPSGSSTVNHNEGDEGDEVNPSVGDNDNED